MTDPDEEAIDPGALDRMLAAIVAERQAAAEASAGSEPGTTAGPAHDPPPTKGPKLRPARGDAPA